MASNFNNTTPAAPGNYANALFQTDGAGNDSAYVGPGLHYSVGTFNRGVGANNDVLYYGVPQYACKFLASAAASRTAAKVAATASTTFTLSKNGTPFATAVFAIAGVTATWTQASDATFNGTTDILEIDGPATADATLANFSITFAGQLT